MNDLSSLILGVAVFLIGWIFMILGRNQHAKRSLEAEHAVSNDGMYHAFGRLRTWMNGLLILVGFGIVSTAFVADRLVWVSVWLVIGLVLIAILGLAIVDAVRLINYYRRSIPRIAQETLGRTSNSIEQVNSTPAATTSPNSSI